MAKKKNPNALTTAQANAKKREIRERRAARAQKAQEPKSKPAPGQLAGRGYDKRPGNNQTKAEKEATRGMVREMRGIVRLIGGTPYGASTRRVRRQNEEGNFTHSTTKHFQDQEKAAERSKNAAINTRYTNMFNALSDGRLSDEEAQTKAGKIGKKRVTFKASRKNAAEQYPEFRFGETQANGKSKGDASAQAVWRTARTMYDDHTKFEGAGDEGRRLISGKRGVAVPEGMTYAKWTSKVGKTKAALTSSVRRKNLQQAAEPPKPTSPKRTTEQVLYDSTQETASNGKGGNKSKWSSRHPIDAFARRENINEGESTSQGKRLRGSLKAGAEYGDKQAKRILGKPTISERERIKALTKTIESAVKLSEKRGVKFTPRNQEEQKIYDSIMESRPATRQTNAERGQRIQTARQANAERKTTAKAQGRRYKRQDLASDWGVFPEDEKGKHVNPHTGETATQAETKARQKDREQDLAKREAHRRARERRAANIATNGRASNPQSTKAEREAALGSGKKKSKTTTQKKKEVSSSSSSSSKPAKGKVTVREVVPKEVGKTSPSIKRQTPEQVKNDVKLQSFVRDTLRSIPKTPYFMDSIDSAQIVKSAKKQGFKDEKTIQEMIAKESWREYDRRVKAGEEKLPDKLDIQFAKKDAKNLKRKKPNYAV